jgi:hypothetical protein
VARTLTGLYVAMAFALMSLAPAALAAPGDEVKVLLEKGDAAAAYAEGKKHPDQLGDPAFDFYFGIAAIDAGHPGEGVLALERYLLNFPDNVSARLQVGRGYFVLGDDAQARVEFEALRKLDPPPDVVAAIDRFLDAIRLRETRYSMSSGAFVEVGAGYDSNANAGPATATIFVPGFGMQPLNPESRQISSPAASVAAGGYVSYPVQPGVTLFANGQASRTFDWQPDARQYGLGNYAATAGVAVVKGKDSYRLGVNYGVITVGAEYYSSALGGAVEWQHQFDDVQSLTLGAQAARLDYNSDNSPRDADFWGVTAVYRRLFNYAWQPILLLGVNAGDQHSRTGYAELVPRSRGASVAVTFTPAEKWGGQLGYTYQQSDYHGPDFFAYPDSRHDKYHAFNAALTYLYSRAVSLRAEVVLARNRSNAEAYAFPREVYALKVRYEFK